MAYYKFIVHSFFNGSLYWKLCVHENRDSTWINSQNLTEISRVLIHDECRIYGKNYMMIQGLIQETINTKIVLSHLFFHLIARLSHLDTYPSSYITIKSTIWSWLSDMCGPFSLLHEFNHEQASLRSNFTQPWSLFRKNFQCQYFAPLWDISVDMKRASNDVLCLKLLWLEVVHMSTDPSRARLNHKLVISRLIFMHIPSSFQNHYYINIILLYSLVTLIISWSQVTA